MQELQYVATENIEIMWHNKLTNNASETSNYMQMKDNVEQRITT